MSKYHNKKTVIDGIEFASKMEGERYLVLRNMEKRGAITYIADFMYKDSTGKIVVEDVKGVETKEFKIKKKMFLYQYGDRYDFRLVR